MLKDIARFKRHHTNIDRQVNSRRSSALTMMNATEFEKGKALFESLLPYIEERSQPCESTLPNLNIQFSKLKKNPASGCHETELHFNPIETVTKEARMALGKELMNNLSLWTFPHTNNPRMNLTISNTEEKFLMHYANIQLHPQDMEQALRYYPLNQAIMDQIADILLRKSFTHFVMSIELHV